MPEKVYAVYIYKVGNREVYGWVLDEHGMIIEVNTTKPPVDFGTRYLGMVCQHESGKWAATWNMVPNGRENYPFDTAEEAVRALPRYYASAWSQR